MPALGVAERRIGVALGSRATAGAAQISAAIPMPALRARQEITPGFGFILLAAEAERFAAAVPSARVVEIDA